MSSKFVFNHLCVWDKTSESYKVFEKLGEGYPRKPSLMGQPLCEGKTLEEALEQAERQGVKHYDIQIIYRKDYVLQLNTINNEWMVVDKETSSLVGNGVTIEDALDSASYNGVSRGMVQL